MFTLSKQMKSLSFQGHISFPPGEIVVKIYIYSPVLRKDFRKVFQSVQEAASVSDLG